MRYGEIIENNKRRIFFVRGTLDPHADLIRNFSCVYNAWVDDEDEIEAAISDTYPDDRSHLLPPRQDPNTGEWCWEPEGGLSSFSFSDEETFKEAMRKVTEYARHLGEVAVFSSEDYDLNAGADGEDLFRNGVFVGWLPLDASYSDFLSMRG